MKSWSKAQLERLYLGEMKSSFEIAKQFNCSENKVNYWLKKYRIPKRSVSEAIYVRQNPDGDPFEVQKVVTSEMSFLYGLGMGLYWGEGTKSNRHSVRLGNTDPRLVKKFIEFLEKVYSIDRSRLHFGLQIFSDMSPCTAQKFWQKELKASSRQFQKVVVTPTRGTGTYQNKTKHGVLTVYFNNKKLRDVICGAIENM